MASAPGKYASGTFGMGTEWIHDFLFDRFRLLAANPLITALFRSVAGAQRNGVTLTNADTNNKGDRVPTSQKWYLWALTTIFQPAAVSLTDANLVLLYQFLEATLITFKIENLDSMFSVPLSFMPIRIQGVQAPAVTVNSHFAMMDNPDATKQFKVPEVLEENAVWYLELNQTVASNGALDNTFLLFGWDRELYRQGG